MNLNDILKENSRRNETIHRPFNPLTGLGAPGERFRFEVADFKVPVQWLPMTMANDAIVALLKRHKTVEAFIRSKFGRDSTAEDVNTVEEALFRRRLKHDFAYWAMTTIMIHPKKGGEPIRFRLNRPQRRLVETLEKMRTAGQPIRLVMLKARQWGGSTAIQLYMAWLQLIHSRGLNSVIVAQNKKTSYAIRGMYERALEKYPLELLHEMGETFDASESRMRNIGQSSDYKIIPARDCTLTIGSYEAPDAVRGDAYSLVHLSEIGLWTPTDQKSPESIVRSTCSGILYRPLTMIVYESTANGTGNFFQQEYKAASEGVSQFVPFFVPWYEIDDYRLTLDEDRVKEIAQSLLDNRNNPNVNSSREESGKYLWWLWEQGATIEAIAWYVAERAGRASHAVMASEYPSDDVEAFVHSGTRVFDPYIVKDLEKTCREPKFVGEVFGRGVTGSESLRSVSFREDLQGQLKIWNVPEISNEEKIRNRYLVVVDIGGRSSKADWSVIAVFDRLGLMDGDKPTIVAQWRGHIDMDLLAWKAAQIATYYDNALLVIESNTLETHERDRNVDGDQSLYLLSEISGVYPNLYARESPEDQITEGSPRKWGFHTNVHTKPLVISTLVRYVRDAGYVERDKECLAEFLTYEKKQNGSFGAIPGRHDDLLMTRAIGLYISSTQMPVPSIVKISPQKNIRPRRGRGSLATI